MSVGESSNGLRGKVKATRDFYRRKDSKATCPILTCDGCEDTEEEPAPRAAGSVAARAQAWEKSTSRAGYVTIGSVRYGVRFSSGAEAVPSRGAAANEQEEADFCCEVMQMAWPRQRGASLPPSKIPLPSAEKTINRRRPTEETATAVFRSTSEASRANKSPAGCFAVDSDESSSGDMKPTPPTPSPARRPLFPKPTFKFGASASDPDTSRLISDAKEDAAPGSQFHITLDKLHRFRFGGGNDKTAPAHKKKRAGDKAERLRELTDKLLHSRGPGAHPDRKKPAAGPTAPPQRPATGPSLRSLFGSTNSLAAGKPAPRGPGGPEAPPEDHPNPAPASQRLAAFRSASFSQGDARYGRTHRECARVRQVDAATSVSPLPEKVTEKTASTPSVDSAVGSDEGFAMGSSNNLSVVPEAHKGARSLTYPFTKKTSMSDEMPFSSIDGNGLKSLQHSPSLNRELSDVKEEVSAPSETPPPPEPLTHSSNDTLTHTCDSAPRPHDRPPDKTVYQCTVSVQLPTTLPIPHDAPPHTPPADPPHTPTTHHNPTAPPKPDIYVTTWPKHQHNQQRTNLTLRCHNDPHTANWTHDDHPPNPDDPTHDPDEPTKPPEPTTKRWSADTSNDCSSEPISPDDTSFRNHWPSSDKPNLTSQSSDENNDDPPPSSTTYHPPLSRNDSLSENDSDPDRRPSTPLPHRHPTSSPSPSPSPSPFPPTNDPPDPDPRTPRPSHPPRRYSKRPLRGPYGQMLEAEMKKPDTTRLLSKKQLSDDLKFLQDYIAPLPDRHPSPPPPPAPSPPRPSSESRLNPPRPRPLNPARSFDDSHLHTPPAPTPTPTTATTPTTTPPVSHHRTASSPSQLEGIASAPPRPTAATHRLLADLLKGASEATFPADDSALPSANSSKDTRTHVVVELFDTERSYVESLQIIVKKYLRPLKSPENVGLVDAAVVDEIFFQVPAILGHHEVLLEELRKRLEQWDVRQKVGDIFMEVFTKATVIETYTSFINNWKTAKEAIRTTCQQRPAFARFLEAMTREHKGKLALDSLIIMPVQRIPRYELLIQRLLKHTEPSHPDHALLLAAQHKVHELAVKINLTEREALELEQQQQTLRDLEALIEGLVDLTAPDRAFVRHDTVTMASGQGTRKERALFLFSDLLIITSIKRRSGTIRKPSTTCPGSVTGSLDANKYKLLMRIRIEELEVVKAKDESVKRMMREVEKLTEDASTLSQISELTVGLHCPRGPLEEVVKEMLGNVNKLLSERQNSDSQLSYLELMLNTQHGMENLSVVFTKPEKRASWEESFQECKQKLALSADRRPSPEFVAPVPIRKTRAGLQFTCAAPTLGANAFSLRDVWVCNSDGYVGQVCVLSLQPEPTVTSCNGVCNARILCIASIPAGATGDAKRPCSDRPDADAAPEDAEAVPGNIELVSSSSSDDEDEGDAQEYSRRSKSEPLASDARADDADSQQSTMWLGTEDGNIHVYLCSDNIRIKKNKVKIQHGSSVQSIIYLQQRVFVSLASGDITVYVRDQVGGWNTSEPYTVSIGSAASPVTKMTPVDDKLWCGCHNSIKVLNTNSLQVEHSFQVSPDASKVVTGMAVSGHGVWVSLQNSAVIKLFHSSSYDNLCDVNVAPAVTKMLAGCDDIIRQHKAACLRVTALLACRDLLWIGTSAGVVLTMTLPHVAQSTTKLLSVPNVTGVPHGHTGHVRFLTCVETAAREAEGVLRANGAHRHSMKGKAELQGGAGNGSRVLVISGGDGYEDFRNSNMSEVAGREDSTNHLLLWHI